MDDYIETADDLARFFYSIAEAEKHGADWRSIKARYRFGVKVSDEIRLEYITSSKYNGYVLLNGRNSPVNFTDMTHGVYKATISQ